MIVSEQLGFLFSDESQVVDLIIYFISYVQTQFKVTVEKIKSNNGSEYVNTRLQSHLSSLGIIHQTTCPNSPQQNGIAERKHQNLLNITRALKFQSQVPISLWGYCVLTAAHLITLLPTPTLNYKTPYQVLFNKQPDYSHLRTFVCLCYITDLYHPTDNLLQELSNVCF